MTSIDISEQWREDWTSASLVNNVDYLLQTLMSNNHDSTLPLMDLTK